jgi:hypothetical protein
MGHVAVVLINMDTVHDLDRDVEFGKKLHGACARIAGTVDNPIQVGPATVIECHHADWYRTMLVGGNAILCNSGVNWASGENKDDYKLQALKALADELGYRVSKKPKGK